eukprot:s1378_g5.t1
MPDAATVSRDGCADERLQDWTVILHVANGSQLGDPIETGAIDKVQREQPRAGPLILMSGKCNKGHGEGVAGVTSLLKALFFLKEILRLI